jgi:hypothetical protein
MIYFQKSNLDFLSNSKFTNIEILNEYIVLKLNANKKLLLNIGQLKYVHNFFN